MTSYLIWVEKDMIKIFTTMQSFVRGNYSIFSIASTSCVVEVEILRAFKVCVTLIGFMFVSPSIFYLLHNSVHSSIPGPDMRYSTIVSHLVITRNIGMEHLVLFVFSLHHIHCHDLWMQILNLWPHLQALPMILKLASKIFLSIYFIFW